MSDLISSLGSLYPSNLGQTLGQDLTGLASNSLGPIAAALYANPGAYRTKLAGPLPPALYAIAIRSGTPPFIPYFVWIFPLSPSMLRVERGGMANMYDVAGNALNAGVQRIVDTYGFSPPIFTVQGSTGVNRHSVDRYLYTGLESALVIQGALEQYFSILAAASQSSSPLPKMELYDYFTLTFFAVVPIGVQGFYQSAGAPQLIHYSFRLVGIQSLLLPLVAAADSLLAPLTAGIGSARGGMG